jgi:hypothetical protein
MRGGVLMRAMFFGCLVLIALGLALYTTIGLAGH